MYDQKKELLRFALKPGMNLSELCRRFGISRKSAYALLKRYKEEGESALVPRSRRPKNSPSKTSDQMERLILEARQRYPYWSGRKLRRLLKNEGHCDLPSPNTFIAVFDRHGLPRIKEGSPRGPWKRYEREQPNELWQMDFKGHVGIRKRRSNPLTIVDDHSRYCICLKDCHDQTNPTVKSALTEAFQLYGLPDQILCDNAPPWGGTDPRSFHTRLSVWLLRLGIKTTHGRPYHPQTQGKNERFNRTLKFELLNNLMLHQYDDLQDEFDHWRHNYNYIRPHDSLDEQAPIQRYRPSPRSIPKELPGFEYFESDIVRKVKSKGEITYKNQFYYIGYPFTGLPIALRRTQKDGVLEVYFATMPIGKIDLKASKPPKSKYILIR